MVNECGTFKCIQKGPLNQYQHIVNEYTQYTYTYDQCCRPEPNEKMKINKK